MKQNKKLVILTVAIILGLTLVLIPVTSPVSPVQAAITWTKYDENPVLEEGTDAWEAAGVGGACVILDGITYKMWYTGVAVGPVLEIGYATSDDAIDWTKDTLNNPVLPKGDPGDWDEASVGSPCVIKEGDDSYKMWYTGTNAISSSAIPAIGYATSTDGITWENRQQVTWDDPPDAWEDAGVLSPCVIWDDDVSLYKMWYSGRSADGIIGSLEIGYATSTDGITWENRQKVLPKGGSGEWDERGVGVGNVIKIGYNYHMWYTGYTGYVDIDDIESAIGYAQSDNGIEWTKDPNNPELTKEGTGWEEKGVGAPWVIYSSPRFYMWYSGLDSSFNPTIGHAQYRRSGGGGGGGGGGPDKSPPRISDMILCDITETTADICWKTHERSDSQVEYRASPTMRTPLDETLVYEHRVQLTDLMPATTYYYKTLSKDKAGNLAVSDEQTFTTLGVPATFQVSMLHITPDRVDIGEEVTISILVLNIGDATASYEVTLKIDDVTVATEEVTIAGGASQEVIFTASKDVAGTYAVSVDGLSGSFTVKEAVPPPPPPPPPVIPPPPPPPFNWWWLIGGIIAAVVAAAVVVWLTVIRGRVE